MKITIPTPCHENWNNMSPDEKGRFCSVCSKTVRDFRTSTDEEIMDVFSDSSENICGNFNPSQLNRDLHYSTINALFAKFAVGFALTAGGLIAVNAQQSVKNDTVETAELKDVVLLGFQKDNKAHQRMLVGGGTVVNRRDIEPLYVLNGKISDYESTRSLDQNSIKEMKILKGSEATALYGDKAKNGVVLITTKKRQFRK
ncbi:hypothetical protein [Chryseobacterium sp. 2987]|uniref:hypothetical protein n=1 Tax=Chryseobacterium sp. 2987 TaxID=2817767 RepID=UPI0028663D7D|nr:hypothetical protein [Chryseobacterium sp. 2987]MDR6920111.1 TonB-dependent SusC/RagA subfamily outer membrane receptor [Chryseobacterium sp. 2987]